MEGKEPVLSQEELLAERKKIITNIVLLMASSFVILMAAGTMAWFRMNKKLESTGMQVTMAMPEMVQVSLGRTNGSAQNAVYPDEGDSLLVLEGGVVQSPRNNVQDASDVYDWSQYIEVSNYYAFGKLFPASSDSGEHILFTPDGADSGRELQDRARFFRADGYTDGELAFAAKSITVTDQDSLRAKAYPFETVEEKVTDDFGGKYVRSASWYDTNDDGYYVEIPVWFRTNFKDSEGITLTVEGCITQGDEQVADDGEAALYKAVRVAFLKEDDAGALTAAVEASANDEASTGNLLPLKNAASFGAEGNSILDSENYTVTRGKDLEHPGNCYGLRLSDEGHIVQSENYHAYQAYSGTVPVIVLEPVEDGRVWSEMKKYWIRIWLDGDDKDCFNETAGQDWKISLRFSVLSND